MVDRPSLAQLTGLALGNYHLQQMVEDTPWGPIYMATATDRKSYIVRFLKAATKLSRDARIVYAGLVQDEAKRIQSLRHPNILPLVEYGNHEGMPYLVYPHINFVSLRALVQKKVPNNLNVVSEYLQQIAAALEYAQGQGILHRSLSSNNVYVLQDSTKLVVAEFGILHLYELAKQARNMEGSAYHRGSTESSAPEQLLGKKIGKSADIYALGAVLFRMLTGHAPFEARTRDEISQLHLNGRIPSVQTYRPELPIGLDAVIAAAMAKDPLQRYQLPSNVVWSFNQIAVPQRAAELNAGAAAVLPAKEPWNAPAGPGPNWNAPQVAVETNKLMKKNAASRPAANTSSASSGNAPQRGHSQGGHGGGNPSRRTFVTAAVVAGGIVVVGGSAFAAMNLLNRPVARSTTTPAPAAPGQTPKTSDNTGGGGGGNNGGGGGGNPPNAAPSLARTADIPENSAKTFTIDGQKNPGIIVHLPGGNNFVAFDTTCTHAGCPVDYNQQSKLLECPCHGASFDPAKDGSVVSPPANSPLKKINIKVNSDGSITQA